MGIQTRGAGGEVSTSVECLFSIPPERRRRRRWRRRFRVSRGLVLSIVPASSSRSFRLSSYRGEFCWLDLLAAPSLRSEFCWLRFLAAASLALFSSVGSVAADGL
jgi:hypothetical protein